jgi:hypothetical protein
MTQHKRPINIDEISKLDELFSDIPRDNSGNFPVFDGIEKYNNAKFRVLWILKEVNDTQNGGGWDLREFLSESTFKDYSRWKKTFSIPLSVTHGLFNNFLTWELLPELDEIDGDILEYIAYINLKKIPGGAKANSTQIYEAYQKTKNLILSHIKLFEPDIVIVCGENLYLLLDDVGILPNNINKDILHANYAKQNGVLFINTYHPAQRKIKQQVHYEAIMQACQKGIFL